MKPNLFIKNRSGIYGLRNLVNGKIYVGKTKCFYRRCHQYVYDFRERKIGHLNDYLFNAISKVGITEFEFFVLEFCDHEKLTERELHWMDKLNSCNRNHGYNLRRDSSGGMITANETSNKISSNLKRQWSEGLRDNHSEKMKQSWSSNDFRKTEQSNLLRKIKTRYTYLVINPDGIPSIQNYQGLVKMGLKSVISNFKRSNSNKVMCKGHRVTRKLLGE